MALTDEEADILRVACADYSEEGLIDNAIHDLGLTWVGFYQKLNGLLETERALAADPVNVNRLRRLRQARMRGY